MYLNINVLLVVRETDMKEILLKALNVIDYLIQSIRELIQVLDLIKEHEEMGMYCIENILDWSINRPIWSAK